MQLNKNVLRAGMAGVALLLSAGVAMAAPGSATGNVNVRTGPGTNYAVVDTLRRGERVEIESCRGNWCYVEKDGPDGWASANYLALDDRQAPRQRDANPGISFSFSFGRGNGFSFGTPPSGSRRDLVCLVTFENRSQVAAGRDADVVRARVMSRSEAERRDRPNDRQGIFDYGTNQQTRETCQYLNRLN